MVGSPRLLANGQCARVIPLGSGGVSETFADDSEAVEIVGDGQIVRSE